MPNDQMRTPWVFLDDGHPEARDYDDNYVALADAPKRGLLARLLANGTPPAPQPRRLPGIGTGSTGNAPSS